MPIRDKLPTPPATSDQLGQRLDTMLTNARVEIAPDRYESKAGVPGYVNRGGAGGGLTSTAEVFTTADLLFSTSVN